MGFDALSPWHLLILAAVFVVLFGSRKLPDAARALRQPSAQQPPAPVATPGSDDTVSDAVSDAPLAEAQRNQRST